MTARCQFSTLALVAVLACGCQSLDKSKPSAIAEKFDIPDGVPWKSDKGLKTGVPARVVATWTNAVLQRAGEGSERGFGGRLFFYGPKDVEPIAVEGQLVVYAFDETGRTPTDNKPTKRFVFPPEQFARHQSESEFGVSYSVWLPWGEVEGASADISLIARFEPLEGGALVVSEQSTSRLPGLGDAKTMVAGTSVERGTLEPVVRQASHDAEPSPPAEPSAPKRRMETTSIKLPRRGAAALEQPRSWRTEVSLGAPAGAGHPAR